jgi:hypothetical protein
LKRNISPGETGRRGKYERDYYVADCGGGVDSIAGLYSAETGHFHLNEERLSGDEQASGKGKKTFGVMVNDKHAV